MGVQETDPLSQLSLPPGFRFYPTDEELLVQYLCRKVAGHHFSLQIIGDIDLYKFDPWVLPSKAKFGEKEWYFFSPRDRKYPNGSRPNRVAGSGYWKATGTDKVITTEGRKVGIKKALVFYVGKAPKGTKTNWIMHEYRLSEPSRKNGSSKLDDWVLCRIYKKNSSGASKQLLSAAGIVVHSKEHSHGSSSSSSSQFDDMLESLPEIDEKVFSLTRMNSLRNLHQDGKINLQNLGSGSFDWATLAGLSTLPEFGHGQPQSSSSAQQIQPHGNNANANSITFSTVNTNQSNEIYGLTFPQISHLDEEVQSGNRTHRVNHDNNNSPLFHNAFAQQDYHHHHQQQQQHQYQNSLDPFGIRYHPTGNVGFRQ